MTDGERGGAAGELVVRLPYRPPFEAVALGRFLHAHAVPGLERCDRAAPVHTRVIRAPHGPALVTVALGVEDGAVAARLRLADPRDLAPVTATLRRWLDLDADPGQVAAALAADAVLAPLVAARPGLRVPGSADGAETAVLTVLGQQVSLAAARTFAGRLVAAFGRPTVHGLASFPAPQELAAAGPQRLRDATGVTRARALTVHALACTLVDGLELHPGAERGRTRERLLALRGIGPWTADYLAVRVLGDRDAFPAGDLVLRRALGVRTAREAEALSQPWRPWRAYALMHLWTQAAFS